MTLIYILGAVFMILWMLSIKTKRDIQNLKDQGLYPGNGGTLEDVQKLINTGNKIAAIKLYREIKNVGLKEAKDEVEKMEIRK